MNIKELRRKIRNSSDYKKFGLCDADIVLILMKVLRVSKTQLIMGEREVTESEEKEICGLIKRLVCGEPVQYLIKECEFMSLKFYVEEGVLIPRADTEVLTEAVIERLDSDKKLKIADMCCGSGCVGISIAHFLKKSQVHFYDFSEKALCITEKNAENILKNREYTISEMNLLKDFPNDIYDCIVSNPPYIKTSEIERLENKVKCYEPYDALNGGYDGLMFYRRISQMAKIRKGGLIAFEIGFDQGCDVAEILKQNGYSDIEIINDIEDRNRVVLGRVRS